MFYTINLQKEDDWISAIKAIQESELDIFIVDQAKIEAACGERLAETA